jgi:hypothetical protein
MTPYDLLIMSATVVDGGEHTGTLSGRVLRHG